MQPKLKVIIVFLFYFFFGDKSYAELFDNTNHIIESLVFVTYNQEQCKKFQEELVALPLSCKEGVNLLGKGEINWSTYRIRAAGKGSPHANKEYPNKAAVRLLVKRIAESDAMKNIQITFMKLKIESKLNIADLITTHRGTDTYVQYLQEVLINLKKAQVIFYREHPNNVFEAIMEISILEDLVDIVYDNNLGSKKISKIGIPIYTGLVIDARGTGIRPTMRPVIVDENGNVVFNYTYVNKEFAIKWGIVGYDKDLNMSKQNERVGSNPLLVKSIKTSKGDITISNIVAEKLRNEAMNLSFLEEARVVVVLDQ